jgi:hypothetical protein
MCSPKWIYGELLNLKLQEKEKKASAAAGSVLFQSALSLGSLRRDRLATEGWPGKP